MSHFAEISGSISGSIIIPQGERSITYTVVNVIVAEQDFIDSGAVGSGSNWVQTSCNTKGGVHYGDVSGSYAPDGGTQLRKNYAGIGYHYDGVGFRALQPFNSWTLNTSSYIWEPPVAHPDDGKEYTWNEENLAWEEQ